MPNRTHGLSAEVLEDMRERGLRFRELLEQASSNPDCPDLSKMDSGEWLDISFALPTALFDLGLKDSNTEGLLRQANQLAADANLAATHLGSLPSFQAMAAFASGARKK